MTPDPRQRIVTLHALYGQLTGQPIRLDFSREAQWHQWLQLFEEGKPLTPTLSPRERESVSPSTSVAENALREVVAYLQRGIREGTRQPGCLKFRNLIGMPDYFEEDLAEARARQRNARPPNTHRSQTLAATGRAETPKGQETDSNASLSLGERAGVRGPRSAAQVLAGQLARAASWAACHSCHSLKLRTR